MPKTTEEDFKIFKDECEYWLDRFSLRNFDLIYSHSDADDDEGKEACAWCKSEDEAKSAILGLSKSWDNFEPTEFQVRKFAFHEVCELLLSSLETLTVKRFINLDMIISAMHSIINRLVTGAFMQSLNERNMQLDIFESPVDKKK